MEARKVKKWGVLWRSENRLDGKTERFQWEAGKPLLFETRKQAREYIKQRWGYIREREDLKREPHGWKMPLAKKVLITLEAA